MNIIRILYIIPSFNRAGGEAVVKNLVENFPKSNFEVSILCLTNEITAPKPKDIPFYVGYGLPFIVKNKMLKIDLNALFKTIKLIKNIKPHIVHYHLVEDFKTIIIPLINFICKTKSVVTIHTRKNYYFKNGLKNRITKNVERWMFSISNSKIIAVSKMEYEFLRYIFGSKRLYEINNGIDINFFSRERVIEYNKNNFGFNENEFLIVMVGRLHRIKNQELAIRGFELVKKKIADAKLILVGKRGGAEVYYKQLVKNLKLDNNVLFWGEVNDVRPILKCADLGLVLSKSEGLSIAMLEMMSMELPIIFSDILEFKNLFNKRDRLIFVDPDKPVELAEAIITLYNDRKRLKELGSFLRDYVQKEFNIENQVKQHITLYQKLRSKI